MLKEQVSDGDHKGLVDELEVAFGQLEELG